MRQFRIVPLSAAYAEKIRTSMQDDFGHPVIEQVATGKGPCRVSLRPFKIGEEHRLLLKHSPFAIDNVYNQPGPVFIHRDPVPEYADVYRFPPEIKADKDSFAITLIGYDSNQFMVFTRLVGDDDIDDLIANTFAARPDIEFLHARSAKACCYICRIERV